MFLTHFYLEVQTQSSQESEVVMLLKEMKEQQKAASEKLETETREMREQMERMKLSQRKLEEENLKLKQKGTKSSHKVRN